MSFSRSAIASLRATRAIRLQVRYLATTPRLRRDVDPFPLPLSDPELAAAASRVPSSGDKLSPEDAELLMPKPLDRTGEDEKTIRARLVYQTRKRGMLEGDLLLSTFARDSLDAMSLAEMQEFDKLLDENDWDIYYWSIDKREAPARWKDTELLQRLKRHARNEGRVVRIMPALVDKA